MHPEYSGVMATVNNIEETMIVDLNGNHVDITSSPNALDPDNCRDLAEVRERIDVIDEDIVSLIARRSRLVKQAASFKKNAGEVAAPNRVEQIVQRVRAMAAQKGMEPDIVEVVYRRMIEGFIREELEAVKARESR